jgi:hypothetical protein
MGIARRLAAMTTVSLLLAAHAAFAQTALSADPCRVRNVTQETTGDSLKRMVRRADDGDRLRVRGGCHGPVVIAEDIVIRGMGSAATVSATDREVVMAIMPGARVRLRNLTLEHRRGSRGRGLLNRGTASIAGSVIRGNVASSGAGILGSSASRTILRNSIVSRNVARLGGGGISSGGYVRIIGSVISENVALDTDGGGIAVTGSLVMASSMVRDNRAYGGGGIWLFTSDLRMDRTKVIGNRADRGGGILHEIGDADISRSKVARNLSTGPGAGIVNIGDSHMLIRASRVARNEGDTGAGIWNNGILIVSSSMIAENRSAGYGSGIWNDTGRVRLDESTITGNRADLDGGGIWNRGRLSLTDATVTSNEAGRRGGGIFHDWGIITLEESSVTGNIPDDCVGTPAC